LIMLCGHSMDLLSMRLAITNRQIQSIVTRRKLGICLEPAF
jgi:hypothetical protein